MSTLHVGQKALEVFDHLVAHGFAGFRIIHSEKQSTWHQQYAYFVVQFDEPDFSDLEDCEYCHHSFDYYEFRKDFLRYLEAQFPKCNVTYGAQNFGVEIIGPHNDTFYNKHFEDLEEIATNHNGYYMYNHRK